jgi:hypothetical protein
VEGILGCRSDERQAEAEEPLYELVLDTLDLTNPELWKSNSFARVRDRLIIELQAKSPRHSRVTSAE